MKTTVLWYENVKVGLCVIKRDFMSEARHIANSLICERYPLWTVFPEVIKKGFDRNLRKTLEPRYLDMGN